MCFYCSNTEKGMITVMGANTIDIYAETEN